MVNLPERITWAANLSTGPWTVFAVTDAGFKELAVKSPDWHNTFTTNVAYTTAMMSNHIVRGLIPRSTMRPGVSIMTLERPIYFDPVDGGSV